jgi:hypothetical protein
MSDTREPEAQSPLTNAERQPSLACSVARYRARRLAQQPPVSVRPAPAAARRSRLRRWNDGVTALITVQAECAAWLDALPDSLRDNATGLALQEIVDLDLEALAAVQPPRGYGRD